MSQKNKAKNTKPRRARTGRPERVPRAERIAFHEAGHVVMNIEHRIPFEYVTIEPGELEGVRFAGLIQGRALSPGNLEALQDGRLTRDRLEGWAMSMLAGVAAEAIRTGRHNWVGSTKDRSDAYDLLSKHVGSHEEAVAYLELLAIRGRQRLRGAQVWARVESVAVMLLQRQRLTSRRVRAVLRDHENLRSARVASRIRDMHANAGLSAE